MINNPDLFFEVDFNFYTEQKSYKHYFDYDYHWESLVFPDPDDEILYRLNDDRHIPNRIFLEEITDPYERMDFRYRDQYKKRELLIFLYNLYHGDMRRVRLNEKVLVSLFDNKKKFGGKIEVVQKGIDALVRFSKKQYFDDFSIRIGFFFNYRLA